MINQHSSAGSAQAAAVEARLSDAVAQALEELVDSGTITVTESDPAVVFIYSQAEFNRRNLAPGARRCGMRACCQRDASC